MNIQCAVQERCNVKEMLNLPGSISTRCMSVFSEVETNFEWPFSFICLVKMYYFEIFQIIHI